jgi:hypothetical protein
MKRALQLALLIAMVLIPSFARAQGGQVTLIRSSVEPLPNCTPAVAGQLQPQIWDITANTVKYCTAPNTWTAPLVPTLFYQTIDQGGSAQTQRPALNFINGTNMTITCVDNAGATRTDCTFTAASTAAVAFSALTPSLNNTAGTFSASGNTWDFSLASAFKVPTLGLIFPGTSSGATTFAPPATGTQTINIPAAGGTFAVNATGPITLSALGLINCPTCNTSTATVSSVSLTQTGSVFNITGSPNTSNTPINLALASQSANLFLASPNGAPGAPTPRAIVGADLPAINLALSGAGGVTGILPKTNAPATDVYTDQSNTYSTGAQNFAAATSLIVPSGANYAPSVSGSFGYDNVANRYTAGINGSNVIIPWFSTGAPTSALCVTWIGTGGQQGAGSCGSPAGGAGTLQYNNSGVLGGITDWTTNGTNNITAVFGAGLVLTAMDPAGIGGGGFFVPAAAGAHPVADGLVGFNTTNHHLVYGSNGTTIDVSAGGSLAFSSLTSATNTTAAMLCGTGCSLGTTGTGTIGATSIDGVAVTGAAATGSAPVATSSSTATWQPVVNTFIGRSGTVVAATNDYNFNQLAGNISVTQMGSGTGASGTTFWRGDGTWATPTGGGGGTWATLTLAGTNTNTGMILAPTSPSTVPFIINAPSGQTANLFDVQLNGVSQFTVTPTGVTWPGTNLNIGSNTSTIAAVIAAHGGNTSSLPGCFQSYNNADTINVNLCASSINGRMMMLNGPATSEIVQDFLELPPTIDAQTGTSYTINANLINGPLDYGRVVTRTNAGAMSDTLGQAGGGTGALTEFGFGLGWHAIVQVLPGSVGSDTITTTTSNFIGCDSAPAHTVVVSPGNSINLVSNGADWNCTRNAGTSSGAGTVTSVSTTGPITGGTFTTTGTIACPTCVIASSPSVGIAHFTGSTQAVVSAPVSLSTDVTGQLPISSVGSVGLSASLPLSISATGAIATTSITGFRFGNASAADTVATAAQAATLIQGLTGCNTPGNVFTPQASDCVAAGTPATNTVLSYALGAGTGTSGALACATASNTQGNCTALPPTNVLGVFNATGTYTTAGIVSVLIDATQNVTFGDNICASSTGAHLAHDNGSVACATGQAIGVVTTTASSVSTVTASLRLQ